MLKIGAIRCKGRCAKHPRYHPETDGLGGIKGGCRRCEMLLDIYQHHMSLVRLIKEFGARPDGKLTRDELGANRQLTLLDL
jgi:hypothetical protein